MNYVIYTYQLILQNIVNIMKKKIVNIIIVQSAKIKYYKIKSNVQTYTKNLQN